MAKEAKASRKSIQADDSPRDTREAPAQIPDAQAGTTDQLPRWEGPPETRPRGYLPALDDPATARDAAGETLQDPDRSDLSATSLADHKTREERVRQRAHRIWEQSDRAHGQHDRHWEQAAREIDAEDSSGER